MLAFVQSGGLWLRELPAGAPVRIASGAKIGSPRFSPSGRWIAFLQGHDLYVISADGRRARNLGPADSGTVQPGSQWAPRADELLAQSPSGLQLFSPENGWTRPVRTILNAKLPVVFSPDHQQFAYADDFESHGRGPGGEPMRTGRLRIRSFQEPEREPRILLSKYLSAQIPVLWSPDGKFLFFWEDPGFSASAIADGLELFRVPAAGGEPQSLGVSTLLHEDMLRLSPNRDQLAICTGGGREEWEAKRIATIDLETAAITYLTAENTVAVSPAWSPDGSRIAFSAAPAGDAEPRRLLAQRKIWIAGAKAQTPLTSGNHYRDEEPVWSAGGSHILFCRIDDANKMTLWLTETEQPRPVQVAEVSVTDEAWFGYYGYIDWSEKFNWFRMSSEMAQTRSARR